MNYAEIVLGECVLSFTLSIVYGIV